MLDSIKDLAPWAIDLPFIPKAALTVIILLMSFIFSYVIWVPKKVQNPDPLKSSEVLLSHDRLTRVLSRLTMNESGIILLDDRPIDSTLYKYFSPYANISTFVARNPEDIAGAYEVIWENGGESRTFIKDTQAFEAVVNGFFREWEKAGGTSSQRSGQVVYPGNPPIENESHRVWIQSHERTATPSSSDNFERSQSESFYRQGLALQSDGDLNGAISMFERAGSLDPTFSKPIIAKAIALEEMGRWDEALHAYKSADSRVEDRHTYALVITNLAATLEARDQLRAAATTYERVLDMIHEPQNPMLFANVHHRAAEVYRKLGLVNKEREHIEIYLKSSEGASDQGIINQREALTRRYEHIQQEQK